MKALMLLGLALLAFTSSAKADDESFWNSPEKLRIAYQVTGVADYATTVIRDPACMSEGNWFIRGQPSDTKVAVFKLGQAVAYELIYWTLKDNPHSERVAFGRVFFIVNLIGPVNNAYVNIKGCD